MRSFKQTPESIDAAMRAFMDELVHGQSVVRRKPDGAIEHIPIEKYWDRDMSTTVGGIDHSICFYFHDCGHAQEYTPDEIKAMFPADAKLYDSEAGKYVLPITCAYEGCGSTDYMVTVGRDYMSWRKDR